MSNFDQAFIKAYARELTSDGELLTAPPRQVLATRTADASDVEFDRSETYYRVDAPAVNLASPKLGNTLPSEPWGDVLPNPAREPANAKLDNAYEAELETQTSEPIIFQSIASVNSNAMELARQASFLNAFFANESTSIEISSAGVIATPEPVKQAEEVVEEIVDTDPVVPETTETVETNDAASKIQKVETVAAETFAAEMAAVETDAVATAPDSLETTGDSEPESDAGQVCEQDATECKVDHQEEHQEKAVEVEANAESEEKAPTETTTVPDKAEPSHETLVPVWEVDNFDWPAVCVQLVDSDPKRWRDAVEGVLKRAGNNSLVVTGAGPALGRTTIAMCIARAYAIDGYRVLLVDVDRQSPEIASRLGLASPCCWGQAMEDKLPLEETTIHSLEDGLTVAPLIDAAAMCEFERMSEQINDYRDDFDLIVYDGGEVSTCLEQLNCINEKVKAAIVVADERLGQASDQEKIAEQLQTAGVIATGVIKNYTNEA